MMSAAVVSSGAASSRYYKAEGYYAQGSAEADAAAVWFGKAAASLGLEGQVDDALFESLLQGQTYEPTPDGLQKTRLMGRIQNGERQHRPGLDLTFSAPKSVSIAALVFGDERLIKAHDEAVKSALTYVEDALVETRRRINGEIVVVPGKGVIAGLFRHDTSRALDPQLHTHAVIANMVRNDTGGFTALHNTAVFEHVKLGSEIYRASLAKSVTDLGYTVQRTGKDRLVEIVEVPSTLVEQFSKRRQEIEEALTDRNIPENPRSAAMAALATRAVKEAVVDREALRAEWLSEAAQHGLHRSEIDALITGTKFKAATRLGGVTRDGRPILDTDRAVHQAISHLAERQTVFGQKQLLETALRFSNTSTLPELERSIARAAATLQLLPARATGDARDTGFTTQELLDTEKALVRSLRATRNGAQLPTHIVSRGKLRSAAGHTERVLSQQTRLSEGQKDAIRVSLTGPSLFVGIQGLAGTGKTFAMSKLVSMARDQGYAVEGLAPSRQAVSQLREAIPESETVQARLLRQASNTKNDPSKTIWVIDEASMLDNKQALAVMDLAQRLKVARVVFSGDVKQLDGVAAGTPFDLLQKSGLPTAQMSDIIRQRDPVLKDAVLHAVRGEVAQAFDKIGAKILEAPQGYAQATAKSFLALTPIERRGTGIVTPSNGTRQAINTHVREGLRNTGEIGATSFSLPVLEPLHLSHAEASDPRSYRSGDILLAHQGDRASGLTKGHLYEVNQVVGTQLSLVDRKTLATLSFPVHPENRAIGALEVFAEQARDFAEREDVKFRITDTKAGVSNGDRGRILTIDETSIRVALTSGKEVSLPHDALAAKGMDHAFALTGHDMQGATVDRVIVAMGSCERLANQKSFYVGISRARDEAILVTDDAASLAERLAKETGQSVSALEAYLAARKAELERVRESDTPPPSANAADTEPNGEKARKDPEPARANPSASEQVPFWQALQDLQRAVDQKDRQPRER